MARRNTSMPKWLADVVRDATKPGRRKRDPGQDEAAVRAALNLPQKRKPRLAQNFIMAPKYMEDRSKVHSRKRRRALGAPASGGKVGAARLQAATASSSSSSSGAGAAHVRSSSSGAPRRKPPASKKKKVAASSTASSSSSGSAPSPARRPAKKCVCTSKAKSACKSKAKSKCGCGCSKCGKGKRRASIGGRRTERSDMAKRPLFGSHRRGEKHNVNHASEERRIKAAETSVKKAEKRLADLKKAKKQRKEASPLLGKRDPGGVDGKGKGRGNKKRGKASSSSIDSSDSPKSKKKKRAKQPVVMMMMPGRKMKMPHVSW